MCGRDLAIGSQSYALATFSGAAVYVSLRELALRGLVVPLAPRIMLSGGTVVALRAWEWLTAEPLLAPMHTLAPACRQREGDHVHLGQRGREGGVMCETSSNP